MKTPFRSLLILVPLFGGALNGFAQQPQFGAPKDYVLVLGDSLAFGYQLPKFLMTQDPANFNTGFADNFTARVRSTPPGRNAVLVNLGCPGESTNSFLTGPCAFHAVLGWQLHINYDGSQVDAAEAFLAAHRGQVGPILIALAANDVFAVSKMCHGLNTQCFEQLFPALLANLSVNYTQILGRLSRAAPDAEIITLGLYNPFAVVPATLKGGDPNNAAVTTARKTAPFDAGILRSRLAVCGAGGLPKLIWTGVPREEGNNNSAE